MGRTGAQEGNSGTLWKAIIIALLVGGSAPWWWGPLSTRLFPPPPPPPARSVVHVRTVSYGYPPTEFCNADKVTALISKRCDGLVECPAFKVDNDLCPDGDPAQQKRKTMRVTYDCSGESRPTASGQDGESIVLSCK